MDEASVMKSYVDYRYRFSLKQSSMTVFEAIWPTSHSTISTVGEKNMADQQINVNARLFAISTNRNIVLRTCDLSESGLTPVWCSDERGNRD